MGDKKYNRLIDSEQRREDKRRESARNCKPMSENLTSRQARALVLLPAKRPRCTMDNVTLFEGDDGQVPDVQAANTGPQRRGPAPALLLQRLQAARIPAGLQDSQEAATKPAPRGKIRYHPPGGIVNRSVFLYPKQKRPARC